MNHLKITLIQSIEIYDIPSMKVEKLRLENKSLKLLKALTGNILKAFNLSVSIQAICSLNTEMLEQCL